MERLQEDTVSKTAQEKQKRERVAFQASEDGGRVESWSPSVVTVFCSLSCWREIPHLSTEWMERLQTESSSGVSQTFQ